MNCELLIDGSPFPVPPDQPLLEALLGLGFDLPYFCWHPAMGSIGACRQCAVKEFKDEHDARGKLVMSCMTPVADGLRCSLADPEAVAFRKSVIEGMMLHHPHDCPVCDEGGHCHLQDMTVMAGHDYRRYRFAKRTFKNQYLGPLVNHEMNRCIQCYRCVRFYREYAGGSDLEAQGISDHVFFGRAADGILESEFAGNLAEVCPTGVFTDATLKRHYTRKWDLTWAPSICAHCSLGCNLSPGERYGAVRAAVNRFHPEINGYFLCDRGRFAYEYLESPARLRQPQIAGAPASGAAALAQLRTLLARTSPVNLIGIGSPRASLEANFALRQLVGPDRFFAGAPARDHELAALVLEHLRRAAPPSLAEIEGCDAAMVLGEDLTQSAARMALSLRQLVRQQPLREICDPLHIPRWLDHAAREAIQDARGPLILLLPWATKLDDIASHLHRAAPDDLARLAFDLADQIRRGAPAHPAARALLAAQHPLIVSGFTCASRALLEAAIAVHAALACQGRSARLGFALPAANSLGLALLAPRPLPEAMDLVRFGHASTAIVLESDLTRLAPAADVAAFRPQHLILLDQVQHPLCQRAELLLPVPAAFESDGTFVNNEGRAQRFFQCAPAAPEARESWRWLEAAQDRDTSLDVMLSRIGRAFPELAPAADAAPHAQFRLAQQHVPRGTSRLSGRTAISANLAVSEPKPPADPDTPLSFTMEGFAPPPPPALTPFFWSPGWNSPQAQLTYPHASAGAKLFPRHAPASIPAAFSPPPAFQPRPDAFWLLRRPHLFGSEELTRHARALASLAPAPYVALNPADAARCGFAPGQTLRLTLDGVAFALPLSLEPSLPLGLALVPAGTAAFDGESLPAWVTLDQAPAT